MDHIDREILQILQHNARASLKMIAEKTFLPRRFQQELKNWKKMESSHPTRHRSIR